MTAVVVMSVLALGVTGAIAALVRRAEVRSVGSRRGRRGRALVTTVDPAEPEPDDVQDEDEDDVPEHLRLDVRGYRMDQVDAVLDRLEAQVRANDATLHALRTGAPLPESEPEAPTETAVSAQDEPGRAPRPRRSWREMLVGADAQPPIDRVPWRWVDLVPFAAYGACALYLLSGFFGRARTGYVAHGVQDQQLYEWFLGLTAHKLRTFSWPFFTDLQNYPDGINLMGNTALYGLGVPLSPITMTAGAAWTYLVITWLGLTLTAFAWYWLFSRRLGVHWVAALLGAWLAGFGPAVVSHANGHLNWTSGFLIPVIVDRLIRLHEDGRTRDGVILGLLVAWQIFIGEEPLAIAAMAIAIFGAALVVQRRVDVRRVAKGAGIGALVAIVIVGFPLWVQFFGRQSYGEVWHPPGGNDLAALWGRATRTINADQIASAQLSMNRTEENAFFGVPLWLVAIAIILVLWRRPVVRALGALVIVLCWLSLGTEIQLHGSPFPLPSLWAVLEHLPVINNILPTRFAMLALPAFGALLALGIEAARRMSAVDDDRAHLEERRPITSHPAAMAGAVFLVLVALLPVFPTPLVVEDKHPIPTFISSGEWRRWVHGGSVVAVPPTDIGDARAMEWQVAADMGFPIVEGYFVGPDPNSDDGGGRYGAPRAPFSEWMRAIDEARVARAANSQQRSTFADDLKKWRADVVVLPEREQQDVLRISLSTVLGEPTEVDGVYVWDVREFRESGTS